MVQQTRLRCVDINWHDKKTTQSQPITWLINQVYNQKMVENEMKFGKHEGYKEKFWIEATNFKWGKKRCKPKIQKRKVRKLAPFKCSTKKIREKLDGIGNMVNSFYKVCLRGLDPKRQQTSTLYIHAPRKKWWVCCKFVL